jgi:hypothetical protein
MGIAASGANVAGKIDGNSTSIGVIVILVVNRAC